ncbi:MAG: NAD(P)/FAD-dependent oxidoreductase [Verrucomicrobia bacterium]|jgi:predicted Rossmann fold flavoprotein|nr:NAD(P)/FAD-dependent oxidoreductase [Verrucomicrobiota bacterium]MDA7651531.1 NAD(P)/FAD-dependent oxidoreductase [Akkermansiaceae bacterium]MBT6399632.1 NAD(P)/FAD-dependent oxidoreductase [Verrucomicrobiota bacterium]MBT7969389.1 NAD(P)/FAD-dependent oxidoreductase [Verrucomicrobiota bacterium]MDB4616225.1 NAD(P)/FAD-dependent oxidoreductase [Akkermansiaceae bacterium]
MSSPQNPHNLIVIGGGAAGFFGAISAAQAGLQNILILERGPEILTKVRISGGGRCNVTHNCYEPHELVENYPRGIKNLMGAFHRFQPADTITWFEDQGVELKVEADGRMFPTTDKSETIINALTSAARENGVAWHTRCGVEKVRKSNDLFELKTTDGVTHFTKSLLVATGGIRSEHARIPAEDLGHKLSDPVPSLFTFKIEDYRLHGLPGVSVPNASLRTGKIETQGPLLITHWGLSGPATLKASAWGARELSKSDYHFTLEINWTGNETPDSLESKFDEQRREYGKRKVAKRSIIDGITHRLWQRLTETAKVTESTTWANLTRDQSSQLARELAAAKFKVTGKSLNKEEFVTCGGVSLDDLNLKTMESKSVPNLYFSGEVLNIDGVTGGFNFQSAWTTGHLAGLAISERLHCNSSGMV